MVTENPMHYISPTTGGSKCTRCGKDATHKVGEEIPNDEALHLATLVVNTGFPVMRHNFTAYVCCQHFEELFGPAVFCPAEARPSQKPRCSFNQYSNMQCLLDENHDGKHRTPCIEYGAHDAHHEISDGWEVICSGYAFDRT